MSDRYTVELPIAFESLQSVEGKLNKLINELNKTKNDIKIGVDDTSIRNIINSINKLSGTNIKIINDNESIKINNINKNLADSIKLEKEKQRELEKEQKLLRDIKDDDLKFIEEVEKRRLKSIENIRNEEKKLAETQAKYSNKALDDNYKNENKNNLNAQKQIYEELNNLQKQEYDIKTKLINAHGEYKSALEETLKLNKESQGILNNDISQNSKLKNLELENSLIKQQYELENKLQLARANSNTKKDDKIERELQAQNKQLDNSINKLKLYQETLSRNNKGGSSQRELNSELQKQIELLEKLKSENKLLSIEEKNRINYTVNNLRNETNELNKSMSGSKNIFKEIFQYAFVGGTTYALIDTLRQGVSVIKEVDDALRDLKRVADDVSDTTLNNFTIKANEMARAIGNTTVGVLQATTIFKQLGYSFRDASEYMAQNAMILSNVGDMSVDDSANSIVSTLKGFRMEAKDTVDVVDVLNETGNNFAITTSQLADGLRIGSASLALANNDLAESTALITTGTEVLRNSDMVANGLKNISMRLRGIKDESGELEPKMREIIKNMTGTDIMDANNNFKSTYTILNELGKSFDKLTDKEQAYLAETVSGKQRANIFASIMQNHEQLEKVYETSNNAQGSAMKEQEAYINSISGKLNSLKENAKGISMDIIDSDTIKTSIDLLDNLITGVRKFQGSFGLFPAITSSFVLFNNKVKESATTLYGAIPGYNKLTSSISKLIKESKESIKTTSDEILEKKKLIKSNADQGESTTGLVGELGKLEGKLTATKIKTVALEAANLALNAAITMGLSIGISFLVKKFSEWHVSAEELKQSVEELNDQVKETMTTSNDMINYLQNEGKAYDELTKKTHLTKEEQAQLKDIKSKIADTLPELIQGYNAETGELELQTKSTKELIEMYKEKIRLKNMELIAGGDDATTVAKNDLKKIEKEKARVKAEIDKIQKGDDRAGNGQYYHNANNVDELTKKLKTLDEGSKEYIETQKKIDSLNAEMVQNTNKMAKIHDEEQVILQKYNPTLNAVVNQFEDLNEVQKKVLTTSLKLTPEELMKLDEKEGFNEIMVKANDFVEKMKDSKTIEHIKIYTDLEEPTKEQYSGFIEDIQTLSKEFKLEPTELMQEFKVNPSGIDKYIKDLEKQLKSATGKSKEKLQNALDIAKNIQVDVEVNGEEQIDALGDKLDEASEKAKELKDALNDSFGDIEKYNGFLKEIGEDGKLSASSVKEILLNYPQLIAYLGNEEAMRNKLVSLVEEQKDASKKNIMEMIKDDKDFYKNKVLTNSDLVKKIANLYDVDLTNYKTIAQAKLGVEKKMLGVLTKKYGEFFKFKNDMFSVDIKSFLDANGGTINRGNLGKLKELEKAAEEQNKQREELMKEFDKGLDFSDLDAVISSIGNLGSGSEETGKKIKDSANKSEKAMSDTEKQILATEQAMKILENRVTRLSRQQEKLNEHTQAYRNGLIEKQKIIKDEIALIEKQIKLNERLRDNPAERNSYDPEKGGSVVGNQIIQEAEKYLNTPYVWGGTTPDGFDCSGFVQYVYKQLGLEISRTSQEQLYNGTPVDKNNLQPGDLVFFDNAGHVGIYAGNGQIIHAPTEGQNVKYEDINYAGNFYGARRIIPSGGSGSSSSGIRSSYSGAYATEINKAAQSYGIDPNLLAAIAKVESNFNPNVTSEAGAMGMFQFMPGTAEAFGVNPWDVQSSANGAAKYMKYLLDMFGNVDQAIQAYNAGEGNISRGIIPDETQAYLPKVKEAMASFGGSYSNNGTVSSVQAQYDYNGKIIDLRGKIEELEDQYSKLYIEILNSHLGEYEDKLKNIERIQEQYRIDVELSGEFNKSYINNLNEVINKEKDKLKLLEQERAFIKTELTSNKYDSKTIDMLNEKYKELGTQMLNVRNESKKLGYEFAEAEWSSIQKLYNDNMELIENKLNRLQLHEEKNIQAIMQLNKQKVEQEQANIERIQALMEELNQRSLTEPFYLDKLAEFNKQLDNANTKLEQAKKELEEVGEKLKNAFSPVESKIKEVIQKSVENSKSAIDKNLKHATDAIDKEIKALDDAQKRNSWNENKTSQANKINDLKKQIAELQADNSSEANSKRKDLQKQLQDELNKSKDMQMKHNADLKKEELNKQKQDLQSEAEKEKKILDVRLENLYLVQEVKDSLLDGYIDNINGQRVEIENALLDYLNIYGEGMSLAGDTFKKEILDAVEIARNLLKGFDKETGFDINKINDNSKTKTIYGTAIDLENAKKIYGADYNYIDTSLVDTSKIQFKKGDLILGGVGTHNGVSQTNIGEATRLEGHGRYDTARVMQLYKDIQSGKIKARNGIVYCNSQADVELARQYLMGLGYTQFVDLSKVKDINSLNIGDNDLIVGGSQFTNKGTYLSGKDRYDTLNKVKDYTNNITGDMIDKNYKDTTKRYVYGNSTDIGIAKSYLNKYGYDFIETNDVRDKNVSDKDIIVGGQVHGAEKVVNAGGQWLWGKNRQATEEEIRKFERKLRGLPGFSQGGIVDFTNIAALHGSKSSVETIFNATQGKKLYNFVDGLPDHFLDSYSKFKMPENKTTNNTTETKQTIIQKAEFVFPNVRNEHDANKFSENILKIMNTGNMQ